MHFVSWGALTHFPCKLRLKNAFHRPGGAGAPTAHPGYAYGLYDLAVEVLCGKKYHKEKIEQQRLLYGNL